MGEREVNPRVNRLFLAPPEDTDVVERALAAGGDAVPGVERGQPVPADVGPDVAVLHVEHRHAPRAASRPATGRGCAIRPTSAPGTSGPTPSKPMTPAASRAAVNAYTSRPWNV